MVTRSRRVSYSPIFVAGVTPFQPLIGAGHGWIGNVGLTYRLLKDTSVSFNAVQAITPTFTGQLQQSSFARIEPQPSD